MVEKIAFTFLGLELLEPMALIFNWIIAGFCFFAFIKLNKYSCEANKYWRLFYLTFGFSTFFGGLGHLFFNYFGFYGKYPSWILGSVSNGFVGMGMLYFKNISKPKNFSFYLIWLKSGALCLLAVITQKFIFVAVDAILTYVFYTGVYAYLLKKRDKNTSFLNYMLFAVFILLPSAFIFIYKINLSVWFNKDDFSHLLILAAIIFFYQGMKTWGNSQIALSDVEK